MKRQLMAILLCAAVPVASPAIVFAQDTPGEEEPAGDYKQLTAQATEAYERGEYEKAIILFEKAYEMRPVSNILYNIGRIYEDAGDIDNAIVYYDRFVVSPNVEQTARKDALERLKTLREVKAMRDGGEKTAEAGENTTETTTATTTAPPPEPEPSTGRTLGWVFLGVGGASLAGAGIFGLLTQGQFNRFESATTLEERRSAARGGATNAVVADTLLITGAVSAAVGAVFLVTSSGGGEKAQASKVRLSPAIGQKAVGLNFGLDF